MKGYHRVFGRFLLAGSLVAVTLGGTVVAGEKSKDMQIVQHADGTVSIHAEAVLLGTLLERLSAVTGVEVYVDDQAKGRTVTLDGTHRSLVWIVKHIAGENYALVYDGKGASALHVMSGAHGESTTQRDTVSPFSGQVKIQGARARMFFTPADRSEHTVTRYISNRHRALEDLARREPEKMLHAQLSFTGYMAADRLLAFVQQHQLETVTLNIGWGENSGGYQRKPGESIQEAIASAARHHQQFLQVMREDADRQAARLKEQGISDDQMRPERAFRENAHALGNVYETYGVPFYGVEVAGTAQTLQFLTKEDTIVRLVDPLWGGEVEEAMTDMYRTIKVPVPLMPRRQVFIASEKKDEQ